MWFLVNLAKNSNPHHHGGYKNLEISNQQSSPVAEASVGAATGIIT